MIFTEYSTGGPVFVLAPFFMSNNNNYRKSKIFTKKLEIQKIIEIFLHDFKLKFYRNCSMDGQNCTVLYCREFYSPQKSIWVYFSYFQHIYQNLDLKTI